VVNSLLCGMIDYWSNCEF